MRGSAETSGTSAVFRELWRSPDPSVRALSGHLLLASQDNGSGVPLVEELAAEALTVLGGGGSSPEQRRRGTEAVRGLHGSMDDYRVRRMLQVGLDRATAEKISQLHTPNFM